MGIICVQSLIKSITASEVHDLDIIRFPVTSSF